MAVCEEIRQSIDVGVPVEVANEEWTQFAFREIYLRARRGPDEAEAETGEGFVRLEGIDDHTTRVTVDLNYCTHYQDMSDPDEIGTVQQHLRATLDRYKSFVESELVRAA